MNGRTPASVKITIEVPLGAPAASAAPRLSWVAPLAVGRIAVNIVSNKVLQSALGTTPYGSATLGSTTSQQQTQQQPPSPPPPQSGGLFGIFRQ